MSHKLLLGRSDNLINFIYLCYVICIGIVYLYYLKNNLNTETFEYTTGGASVE